MNLPSYMSTPDCRRWLLWKSESQDNSKPRKVPYYANGKKRKGKLDSPDDIAQLVSFDEAQVALSQGEYTGLGFALGVDHNGSYWQGIDFDDIDSKPALLSLITSLPGYIETSPSKNGVHAIGYGRQFNSLGSNKSGIEAYCSGRFFTVTGDNSFYFFTDDTSDLADFVEKILKPLHIKNKNITQENNPALPITTIDKTLVDTLHDALCHISSDEYDTWIAVGHALKGLGGIGFELWSKWSAKSVKFKGEPDLSRWNGFAGERTGYQSVFVKAKQNGWKTADVHTDLVVEKRNVVKPNQNNAPNTPLTWTEVNISDLFTNPSMPTPFIVESLLPCGVVTLLTAHGGTGKSMLALQLAVCVAMGFAFMNKQTIPSKVLFFSAEDATQVIRCRLECICRDKNIDPTILAENLCIIDSTMNPGLYITQHKANALTHGYEDLYSRSVTYDAGLIVIDNASDTFDANENERARVREFIRLLTQLAKSQRAAVLLLAHIDKDTAKFGSGESYSGSTAWHNSARSRLFLSIDKESEILSLAQQKSNLGQLASTIHLQRGNKGILYLFNTPSVEEASVIILSLIEKYYDLGQFISPSKTSPSNPYKTLHKDSDFPQITRKQLTNIIEEMLAQNMLIIETYQTDQRKDKQRYRSARSAPTSDMFVCADDTTISSCSAPTTTGGMGEEGAEYEPVKEELPPLIDSNLTQQNLNVDKNDKPTIESLFCKNNDEFNIEYLLNMHKSINVPGDQITKFLPDILKLGFSSVKDVETELSG